MIKKFLILLCIFHTKNVDTFFVTTKDEHAHSEDLKNFLKQRKSQARQIDTLPSATKSRKQAKEDDSNQLEKQTKKEQTYKFMKIIAGVSMIGIITSTTLYYIMTH